MQTDTHDGMEQLIDYLLLVASRRPDLVAFEPKTATLDELIAGGVLIVQDAAQARFSVLLAEALVTMSADLHTEGDRALPVTTPISREQALVLTKTFGGLAPAARATGVSRSTIWRALRKREEVPA